MSVNSSSASNSTSLLLYYCLTSEDAINSVIAVITMRLILILPLYILILYLVHQQWQQQSSFKTTSHSDIFTYHRGAMELIWVLGCLCYLYGAYANLQAILIGGLSVTFVLFIGEIFFHLLTCVERYLAVVHPITYIGLRSARGVRIRNISTGCVWLLCFISLCVIALYLPNYPVIHFFCLLVTSLIVVSFCSLSILCVLIRPRPGEGGKERERADQSKRRAFHTTTAIMGALWLWFGGMLVSIGLDISSMLSPSVRCKLISSSGWFNVPSSLVLPLLYIHRAGKLPSCLCNNE